MDGIINVYKEKGFTSFDVVAKLRGILKTRKIGHTGTLDPDAEGVLPVCVGHATKVCDLLTDRSKEYVTELLLGVQTDTLDITGQILEKKEVKVTEEEVRHAVGEFVGDILQVPPMYSALKQNGQKLCDLARKGIVVERKARPITIFEAEILEIELPVVRIRVHCSKGTYIRTLCDDIGTRLGCGGCMKSLVRTRVSEFDLSHAFRLSEIEEMVKAGRIDEITKPVDVLFENLPSIWPKEEAEKLLQNGNALSVSQIDERSDCFGCYENQQNYRIYHAIKNREFCGIYQYDQKEDRFKPVKLFFLGNGE